MQSINWQSEEVRGKIRKQIDESLRASGHSQTAVEVEKQMFEKSKTQDDYINFAKRIISSLKNTANSRIMRPPMQPAPSIGQQQGMVPQGMNQQNMDQQNMNQQIMASGGMDQQNMVHGIRPQPMNQMPQQGINQPNMGQPGMPMRNAQTLNRGNMMDHPNVMPMQPSPLSNTGGNITNFSPDRMQHPSPSNNMYNRQPPINRMQQQAPNMPPTLQTPEGGYPNTPQNSSHIPSLSPAHPNTSPQVSVMSPALRTPGSVNVSHSPGNPLSAPNSVPSPAQPQQLNNPNTQDEKYMEKLKQLQKYIEPLSRMINREKHNKDVSKMKNLRDTLMDSKKRFPMATLLRCEQVLKNWCDVGQTEPTPPAIIKPQPDQHMCQPLLDVVASRRQQPMLNHTLKRTFGPALAMLNGNYSVPENVCCKSIKLENYYSFDDNQEVATDGSIIVPDIIQGEIARLNAKFAVTVDQSKSTVNGHLHLICRLYDNALPSVPPIHIVVPSDYPSTGVEWKKKDKGKQLFNEDDAKTENNEDMKNLLSRIDFLKRLEPIMDTQIGQALESSQTISSVLTAWEISIRQSIVVV